MITVIAAAHLTKDDPQNLYTISQGQAMKVSAKFRPRLVDLPRIHVKGLFTHTKLIQLNNNNNLKKRCWV